MFALLFCSTDVPQGGRVELGELAGSWRVAGGDGETADGETWTRDAMANSQTDGQPPR